VTVIFQAA